MRVMAIIKGIISYIAALALAVIFALFLNANVGWFLLIALILAPVLSVFFAWLSAGRVSVTCSMEQELLTKGDTCVMAVCVKNSSIFPTPPIELILTDEARVRSVEKGILVSVLSMSSRNFEVTFRAKICGPCQVGIESLRVTDYLGLFSFHIRKADRESLKKEVAVIPEIADIPAKDENILKAMQVSLHTDDSEDTIEAQMYAFGGFPGYDSRDYVPGDPLKRINWKQSAKRNKLLVRLDDEMSSQSISVVLDSVFLQDGADIQEFTSLPQYRDCAGDEIFPKIAEEAVENALGIVRVLLRHEYTVNFYAVINTDTGSSVNSVSDGGGIGKGGAFVRYELEDESDLENVRLALARYRFGTEPGMERFPREELLTKGGASFLFSTPNSYAEASAVLEGVGDNIYTTIYAAVEEEAKKLGNSSGFVSVRDVIVIGKEKTGFRDRLLSGCKNLAAPYLLALLLSISVFGVFDIPVWSPWTFCQVIVCAAMFAFCEYVNRHRFIGTMLTTVLILVLLNLSGRIVFGSGYGLNYMHWFLSGGESVNTTAPYLLSLIMVFTVFFSFVVYYFARILYRTSFLLLTSLIPFVIYVKVMQDINMVPVVFITVLNILIFLLHTREKRDMGKRRIGQVSRFVSLGVYLLFLVLMGLWIPKEQEARYYYLFENTFLGGNVSEPVPADYSEMSEFSGNADGFNTLNNRKLYEISGLDTGASMYLKRQNFDLYDFENDRWYSLKEYGEPLYPMANEMFMERQESKSITHLAQALLRAEELQPGFLARYGLQRAAHWGYRDTRTAILVRTTNFSSAAYVVPSNTIQIITQGDTEEGQQNAYVSRHGVFQRKTGYLDRNLTYRAEYFDESKTLWSWIGKRGSNCDTETSVEMLGELCEILQDAGDEENLVIADAFYDEARTALEYREACAENTEQIPERIRELAALITEDCVYDWQKAQALAQYFEQNDFGYDLNYKAPDDSVEYFLFEGKIGTCSDFASAYALMARSVGLTVRYAEGFVPRAELDGIHVVRADCGHAFPEVYIPNAGYVVFEATRPAWYAEGSRQGSGLMAYFMTVGARFFTIFAMVCAVIVIILFLRFILEPFCREIYFVVNVRRAQPGRAVVMYYKRLRDRYLLNQIPYVRAATPYQYAEAFEKLVGYDISRLCYLLERNTYTRDTLTEGDRRCAGEIYREARKAIRAAARERRRKRRQNKNVG